MPRRQRSARPETEIAHRAHEAGESHAPRGAGNARRRAPPMRVREPAFPGSVVNTDASSRSELAADICLLSVNSRKPELSEDDDVPSRRSLTPESQAGETTSASSRKCIAASLNRVGRDLRRPKTGYPHKFAKNSFAFECLLI